MESSSSKWWILVGTCFAGIMVALDFTIVNTSLNAIQISLQSTMQELQWFIAGFGLTFCSFLATAGRLSDLLGRRKLLYISLIAFGIASIGAGMSQTSLQLILFRLLQGLAGSIVFPAGMAITVDAFPKEEEGRALGVYGALIGVGLALGPLLGGFITAVSSWRWIFYINIPVIITSFIICMATVHESRLKERVKIDWWGMLFMTLFIACLIYAVTEGPDLGWASPTTIALFVVSIASFFILLTIERRVATPLLPLKLFMNHGFLLGCIFYIVGVSSAWVLVFFAPLYLHNVLGYMAAKIGLLMLPMTLMTMLIPTIAGYFFDKRGIKFSGMYLIFLPVIFSYILMIGFDLTVSLWLLVPAFILFGFAWGASNGISMPAALSELEDTTNAGVVSGAVITILNVIGLVALTVSGTVFRSIQSHKMFAYLQSAHITLTNKDSGLIKILLAQPEKAMGILSQFSHTVADQIEIFYRQAFVHGFVSIIIGMLFFTLLFFIWVKWLLRDH